MDQQYMWIALTQLLQKVNIVFFKTLHLHIKPPKYITKHCNLWEIMQNVCNRFCTERILSELTLCSDTDNVLVLWVSSVDCSPSTPAQSTVQPTPDSPQDLCPRSPGTYSMSGLWMTANVWRSQVEFTMQVPGLILMCAVYCATLQSCTQRSVFPLFLFWSPTPCCLQRL